MRCRSSSPSVGKKRYGIVRDDRLGVIGDVHAVVGSIGAGKFGHPHAVVLVRGG